MAVGASPKFTSEEGAPTGVQPTRFYGHPMACGGLAPVYNMEGQHVTASLEYGQMGWNNPEIPVNRQFLRILREDVCAGNRGTTFTTYEIEGAYSSKFPGNRSNNHSQRLSTAYKNGLIELVHKEGNKAGIYRFTDLGWQKSEAVILNDNSEDD
jgi:hypothetical protein